MENKKLQISKWAKDTVFKHSKEEEKLFKEYVSLVKGLGAMIIQNGLLATLIFLKVKGKNHHTCLKNDVINFIEFRGYHCENGKKEIEFNENEYLHITQEVLDMVSWLRRYADIFGSGADDK